MADEKDMRLTWLESALRAERAANEIYAAQIRKATEDNDRLCRELASWMRRVDLLESVLARQSA